MKSACSACKVTTLNFTVSDQENNAIVPGIVSALQRNPSIKYVVATDGLFTSGLPAAMAAAGISGVKITGAIATAVNEQDIGQQDRGVRMATFNFDYVAWQAVDVACATPRGCRSCPTTAAFPSNSSRRRPSARPPTRRPPRRTSGLSSKLCGMSAER